MKTRTLLAATLFALATLVGAHGPVVAQAAIGGDGFTLSTTGGSILAFAWQGGTAQSSYELLRLDATGATHVQILPASTTTAFDRLLAAFGCYQLTAQDSSGATIRWSRVLCTVPQAGSGAAPTMLSIHFVSDTSTLVSLAWTPLPGATAQALVPIGSSRVQILNGTTTTALDDPGGQLTCYVVASANGSGVTGVSAALCALPTAAHLFPNPRVVTLADNGTTVNLQIGDTVLVDLDDGYTWRVSVGDPTVLRRVPDASAPADPQGVYQALKTGQTVLSATGDPPCYPLCLLPSRLFQLTVRVLSPPPSAP